MRHSTATTAAESYTDGHGHGHSYSDRSAHSDRDRDGNSNPDRDTGDRSDTNPQPNTLSALGCVWCARSVLPRGDT